MSALILTRRDIAALMRPGDYLRAVEEGFRAEREGRAASPSPMKIAGEGGAFHAKGAAMRAAETTGETSYVALKLNGNFPGNPRAGLPTIQGAILLCDGLNGALLAILDSIEVTRRRTAAASALAARHLARAGASSLLVVGCGEQAGPHVEALAEVMRIGKGRAFDLDTDKAERFAAEMQGLLGIEFREAASLADAAREADVIVTLTTASAPILFPGDIAQGAFLAAVGADSPAKLEIAPGLMAGAKVVADSARQCAEMGDLRAAIAAGAMTAEDIHAELGEIVAGERPGRTAEDEIFIFDSTGTALEDVASAALIYERALERGAGTRVALDG